MEIRGVLRHLPKSCRGYTTLSYTYKNGAESEASSFFWPAPPVRLFRMLFVRITM